MLAAAHDMNSNVDMLSNISVLTGENPQWIAVSNVQLGIKFIVSSPSPNLQEVEVKIPIRRSNFS